MKIALLQCNAVTGDVVGNVERIAAAAREAAAAGVDLCVTPELALVGPEPGSYAQMVDFADGCGRGLDLLAEAVRDAPPLLVGAPVRSVYAQGLLSNAAVLCRDGQWQITSRKVGVGGMSKEGRVFELGLSCGILTLGGWRLGIALCGGEADGESPFWEIQYASGHNPLMEMIQRGVDAIVHMSATPFCRGAQDLIEHRLSHVAARHHVHLFSVNLAGGFDSGVYGGQSLAFDPTGQLLARGKAFEEEVLIVDTAAGAGEIHPSCACPEEAVWRALTLGVRDFVSKCHARKAIVGLSGGMDSALVCAVAAEALGAENVLGVLMPSPYSSEGSVTDSLALAENLGVQTVTLPIQPVMRAFADALRPGLGLFPEPAGGDTTFENVQARIRGVLLSSLANPLRRYRGRAGRHCRSDENGSLRRGRMVQCLARQGPDSPRHLRQGSLRRAAPRSEGLRQPAALRRPRSGPATPAAPRSPRRTAQRYGTRRARPPLCRGIQTPSGTPRPLPQRHALRRRLAGPYGRTLPHAALTCGRILGGRETPLLAREGPAFLKERRSCSPSPSESSGAIKREERGACALRK